MIEYLTIIALIINWLIVIIAGIIIYKLGKRMAKSIIKEALNEYSIKKRDEDIMHKVTETRNKYFGDKITFK
jgi:hypothetical protein